MNAAFKFATSALLGALLSMSVFWVLWYSIHQQVSVGPYQEAVRINFTRMRRDTPVATKRDEKPEREPPPPTPQVPSVAVDAGRIGTAVAQLAPAIDVHGALSRVALTAGSDRDVLPLVRIPPDYPPRAVSRGIEGWVKIQFNISSIGTVKDAKVIAADPPGMFDDAALKSISRWRYNPKVEGGVPVERVGVQTVIRFELQK
jgi:protein TonB